MTFNIKKIKIPFNVSIIINYVKNLFIIKGSLGIRFLKLSFVTLIVKSNHYLIISDLPKAYHRKKVFFLQNQSFFFFTIKKFILEVSFFLTKKLKFIGLGYKFFLIDKSLKLLQLNLGYSHKTYFKPLNTTLIYHNKNVLLYFKSLNYNYLNTITALLKQQKLPDSYKGKGILFENDVIIKKKIKKI